MRLLERLKIVEQDCTRVLLLACNHGHRGLSSAARYGGSTAGQLGLALAVASGPAAAEPAGPPAPRCAADALAQQPELAAPRLARIEARTSRLERVTWISAGVATVLTEVILARGGHEETPWMRKRWQRLLLRPAVLFAGMRGAGVLARDPRWDGKLGTILQYAIAGVSVADAGWDLYVVVKW